jgi:hypothetical protein
LSFSLLENAKANQISPPIGIAYSLPWSKAIILFTLFQLFLWASFLFKFLHLRGPKSNSPPVKNAFFARTRQGSFLSNSAADPRLRPEKAQGRFAYYGIGPAGLPDV